MKWECLKDYNFQLQLNDEFKPHCVEKESCALTGNNYSSARHIWYVYSHSYHFYSSFQMNQFNSKKQHNLWGLFTALSKSQNYSFEVQALSSWGGLRETLLSPNTISSSQQEHFWYTFPLKQNTEKQKQMRDVLKGMWRYAEMWKVKWEHSHRSQRIVLAE